MTESDATRDYLIYCVEVLKLYFKSRPNVYVSGNLFVYYEEGNPQAVVSPDVFIVFGVSARKRRSYQAWKEGGKLPNFVLEITSRTTKRQDQTEKPLLYANLGVEEYFQYDPTADYLKPQLKGGRLVEAHYEALPIETTPTGVSFIHSSILGLDLQLCWPQPHMNVAPLPQELRFYDPKTGTKLLSREELEQERDAAQQERDVAQQERDIAQQRAEQLAAQLRALGLNPDEAS